MQDQLFKIGVFYYHVKYNIFFIHINSWPVFLGGGYQEVNFNIFSSGIF